MSASARVKSLLRVYRYCFIFSFHGIFFINFSIYSSFSNPFSNYQQRQTRCKNRSKISVLFDHPIPHRIIIFTLPIVIPRSISINQNHAITHSNNRSYENPRTDQRPLGTHTRVVTEQMPSVVLDQPKHHHDYSRCRVCFIDSVPLER